MGIEDSDSEMSEGEIFQVNVGRIDLQKQEMEGPLDDKLIGTLGAIMEEDKDDFSSDEDEEITEQSSVTVTIATQEPRDLVEVIAEKKAAERIKDSASAVSLVTATIATKSVALPLGSTQTKVKEDENNKSMQSSATMSIVSAVEGRERKIPSKKAIPPAPDLPRTNDDNEESEASSVTASIAIRTDLTPIPASVTKTRETSDKGVIDKIIWH